MASPTRIGYGNNLITPIAQPGWQVEADGFGLMQAQVKFKWTNSQMNNFTTKFAKGTTFSSLVGEIAPSNLANLKVWRANYVYEKADVLTVTADFCGIDPNINGGARTNPQMVMTGSAASEPIEHHPNFLQVNCFSGGLVNKLAGFPSGTGWDDNIATNPNRALWRPAVAAGGATQAFQFVGFLPNQKAEETVSKVNIKAGIKNYYKPSNTMRVLFYVNSLEVALTYASYVGWVTDGSNWNIPAAYRQLATGGYAGSFQWAERWSSQINKSFLITNGNVEEFGGIYKVTADMMLSGISGWDKDIYPNTQAS
jgi:hypothetical protein